MTLLPFHSGMTRFLYLLPVLLLLGACSFDPQRMYLLSPDGPPPSRNGRVLGVGPIRLADYLLRPEIPVQTRENELEYAFENLWAGTADKQIGSVLSVNLGRRLRTGAIHQYPWEPGSGVEYQVSLDVRKFHSTLDGRVMLDVGWRIYDLQAKKILTSRSSTLETAIEGEGFQAAFEAKSRLLSRLAGEISAAF